MTQEQQEYLQKLLDQFDRAELDGKDKFEATYEKLCKGSEAGDTLSIQVLELAKRVANAIDAMRNQSSMAITINGMRPDASDEG